MRTIGILNQLHLHTKYPEKVGRHLVPRTMHVICQGNPETNEKFQGKRKGCGRKTQRIMPSMPLTFLPTSFLLHQWFSVSLEYFFSPL